MSLKTTEFITKTFSNTNKEGIDIWLNSYADRNCKVVGYISVSDGAGVIITIKVESK